MSKYGGSDSGAPPSLINNPPLERREILKRRVRERRSLSYITEGGGVSEEKHKGGEVENSPFC